MTGRLSRHILPHLSAVPHLHVNRPLRVWVSTVMSLLHLRTKLLHCSVSRQFSGQLIINVLGSRPPRPELWALKQPWGLIRIHGVEIRSTINQHWFPPPSLSLYQTPDPPASKILNSGYLSGVYFSTVKLAYYYALELSLISQFFFCITRICTRNVCNAHMKNIFGSKFAQCEVINIFISIIDIFLNVP